MRVWVAILCSLMLCAVTVIRAQEVTPEPIRITADAEVIYPAAIRYTVTVPGRIAQIESAALTITVENRDAVLVDLDLVAAEVTPEPIPTEQALTPTPEPTTTTLAYIWMLSATDPPRLFRPITFAWDVTLNDGERLTIEETFTFEDQRFNWITFQDPDNPLSLTLPSGIPNAAQLAAELWRIETLMRSTTDQERAYQKILYYPGVEDAGCLISSQGGGYAVGPRSGVQVDCDTDLMFDIPDQSGFLLVQRRPEDTSIREHLIQRSIHAFYAFLWDDKNVPQWFRQALFNFYAADRDNAAFAGLLTAARANRLLSIAELETCLRERQDAACVAQSNGMLRYILDQVGQEGLFRLATVRDGETFEEAYAVVMDEPLIILTRETSVWLFTEDAQAAFAVDPYQVATVVPTLTPTASGGLVEITLSATPAETLTATATSTATATLTGTPSRTASPLPPTRTPRPAGSLDTPTPTPIPTIGIAESFSQPGTQSLILAVLILLIGIALFAYIRSGKRA